MHLETATRMRCATISSMKITSVGQASGSNRFEAAYIPRSMSGKTTPCTRKPTRTQITPYTRGAQKAHVSASAFAIARFEVEFEEGCRTRAARLARGPRVASAIKNRIHSLGQPSRLRGTVCDLVCFKGRWDATTSSAPSKFTVTSRNAFQRARSNAFHRHEFEFSKEARNREKARRGAAVFAIGGASRGQDNERRGARGCGRAKRAPTWRYTRCTPMRSRTATTTRSSGWCSATARAPPPASTRTQGFTRGRRAATGRARPRPTSPPRTARPPPPPRPPRASRRGRARPSSARPSTPATRIGPTTRGPPTTTATTSSDPIAGPPRARGPPPPPPRWRPSDSAHPSRTTPPRAAARPSPPPRARARVPARARARLARMAFAR